MIPVAFAAIVVCGLLLAGWLDACRIRRHAERLEQWFPTFAEFRREQADSDPVSVEQWQELLDADRQELV